MPRVTPMPFQTAGVDLMDYFDGRVILGDEMGLGKTLQAAWWLERDPQYRLPAVVVCPANLKINWERELTINAGLRVQVLEGTNARQHGLMQFDGVMIVNYEILKYWVPYLLDCGISTLIVDECQRIQNMDSQCTVACHSLARGVLDKHDCNKMKISREHIGSYGACPYVVAVSGTPLTNRPSELYSSVKLVWPGLYKSFGQFAQRYCRPRKTPWGIQYSGATRLSELHNVLKDNGMIRRLKRDVLKDLPHKVRRVVPLPLWNLNEYQHAESDLIGWLETISPEAAKRASKAVKLTELGYLKRLAARYKLKAACEWVDTWLDENPDEKIVLFGVHTKLLEVLQRRYTGQAVSVVGGMTATAKQHAVDSFQLDPKVRVFIGQMEAAGVGITLTAASNMAFLELDFRPAIHQQAEARIDRIGQDCFMTMWYLVAAGTIEERLCGLLQDKSDIVTSILDGDEREDREVLTILDTLMESMGSKLVSA